MYDFRKYNCSKSNTFDDLEQFGEETETIKETELSDETQLYYDKICSNRIPLSLYWDSEDPRLLVCNAKKLKLSSSNIKKGFVSLYGSQNENKN
ncbi:hypothetical protein ILUMI_18876, partial [Ignelater luminosus]